MPENSQPEKPWGLILAAGLDGIEKKMPLPAPVNRNLFHKSAAEGLESLPESLREAITIAAQSDFIAKELGPLFYNAGIEEAIRTHQAWSERIQEEMDLKKVY